MIHNSDLIFEPADYMDVELEVPALNDGDILAFVRSNFNTTPVSERHYTNMPFWVDHSMPWFVFQSLIRKNPLAERIFHPASSSISSSLPQSNLALEDRQKILSGVLVSNFTFSEPQLIPKLSSMIRTLVPERFKGEVSYKLQHFLDPSKQCSVAQIAEFAILFISNNALDGKSTDLLLKWIMKDKPTDFFRLIFQIRTPTVQALSTRLLESTARCQDASTLQFLIDAGIDKNELSGIRGGRILQLALSNAKVAMVPILLDNSADVNPPISNKAWPFDTPPLHYAAQKNEVDTVRRLLDAGALVDCYAGNETALSLCLYSSNVEAAQVLIDAGADVSKRNKSGNSILDWAFLKGNMDIYHMLLSSSPQSEKSLTISGILQAAQKGHSPLSKYLERSNYSNTFSQQEALRLALYAAVNHSGSLGSFRIIKALLDLESKPNINFGYQSKSHALKLASKYGLIDIATLLLDAGADINTPKLLSEAAKDEYGFEFLNFLVEQGIDIELFGADALAGAITFENTAAVKLLLKSGAPVDEPDDDGNYPIQVAAGGVSRKIASLLIRQGADVNAPVNKEGYTTLHFALQEGDINMVKFLLDAGAQVNTPLQETLGKTSLEVFAERDFDYNVSEHIEVFELLMKAGARINGPRVRKRCRQWNSALTSFITRSAGGQTQESLSAINKFIQDVLEAGSDVNQPGQGEGARTPIQAAAEVGNICLVKELLKRKANINAPAAVLSGRTALQAACSNERANMELIELLLSNGADVDAEAGIMCGLTALQGAAIQGHMDIVLLLLDAGADVNADPAEEQGRMALDGAAEHGRLEMVQLLLNANAMSEEYEGAGYDWAIELAEGNGHFAVAELLKSHSTGI